LGCRKSKAVSHLNPCEGELRRVLSKHIIKENDVRKIEEAKESRMLWNRRD
jgi:hypothetical protein